MCDFVQKVKKDLKIMQTSQPIPMKADKTNTELNCKRTKNDCGTNSKRR